MKHSVIGMDIAKRVFQLHSVDPTTGEIERIKLRRDEVLPFFAQRSASLVAIEACGSAHWWARELRRLGHEVKLLAPKSVRPFVRSNKTDAADARAIWTAVQQPEARLVAVKSEQQQAILALHRLRAQLMKFRIMQTNALRGLLYEFGEVLPEGYSALAKALPAALASVAERLPAMLIDSLREQWARVQMINTEITTIERRLASALRASEPCRQIAAIPGVGLLTATAAVAALGEPNSFASGREFAAWLGLVPRQNSTGGKIRLGGITKRGNRYLRRLLINGASANLLRSRATKADPWVIGLRRRRPPLVVAVALANKTARIAWAVMLRQKEYQPRAVAA